MTRNHNLSADEAEELFSELDASGVVDPDRGRKRRGLFGRLRPRGGEELAGEEGPAGEDAPAAEAHRTPKGAVDPLSEQDPSGSQVGKTISRTAIFVIVGVFVFVIGMQLVYGVSRRLSTANLSERANVDTVSHAMESGVEWGNGFTQFPQVFEVDEASEKTGTIEVSVTDTDSANELELLSNSQIQASALATNALLNEKITRVVYNVYALVGEDGSFQHDRLFGFLPAEGTRRAMLTFIWTKSDSPDSTNIDWELKIIGMDDDTAQAIQKQVNSVSSLSEKPGITQSELDGELAARDAELDAHGEEVLRGGVSKGSVEDSGK